MLDKNHVGIVVEAQRRAEKLVADLRASGVLESARRAQEQLNWLVKWDNQFQDAARRAVEILPLLDTWMLQDAARISKDLDRAARLALPSQIQLEALERQMRIAERAALMEIRACLLPSPPKQQNTHKTPLNPPQEHPQELIPDSCDKSEKERRIESFRFRMLLYDLLEDMEDYPPEDYEFPFFEQN